MARVDTTRRASAQAQSTIEMLASRRHALYLSAGNGRHERNPLVYRNLLFLHALPNGVRVKSLNVGVCYLSSRVPATGDPCKHRGVYQMAMG